MALVQDRKINVQGFLDSLSGRQGGAEEDLLAKRRQSIAADISTAAAKSPTPFKTSLATLMGDTLGKGLLRAFNIEDEERQRAIDTDQANKLIVELQKTPNSTNLFKIGEIKAAMGDSVGAVEAFGLANTTKQQEASALSKNEFASRLAKLDPTAPKAREEAIKLLNQANLSDDTRPFAPQIVNVLNQIDSLSGDKATQTKMAADVNAVKTRAKNGYGINIPDDVARRIAVQGIGTVVTADGQVINKLEVLLNQYVQENAPNQSITPKITGVINTPVYEQKQQLIQQEKDRVERIRQEEQKRKEEEVQRKKIEEQDKSIQQVLSGSALQESLPTLTAIQEISTLMGTDENRGIGKIKQDPVTKEFIYDKDVDLENFSLAERKFNSALRAVGLGEEQNPIYLAYVGLQNAMLKEQSGAAVTASEFERLQAQIIGDDLLGVTEETLITFVNALRNKQENKWNSLMSQMDEATQERFLQRNNFYYTRNPENGKLIRESFPGSGKYIEVTEKN